MTITTVSAGSESEVAAEDDRVLSIREVAGRSGLTAHTLRWYERIGLLERIDRGTDGRRRFTQQNLSWLGMLTKLRATGMPVADMLRYAELVRAEAGQVERLALLEEHRTRVRAALIAQQECLELLDYKIDYYRSAINADLTLDRVTSVPIGSAVALPPTSTDAPENQGIAAITEPE